MWRQQRTEGLKEQDWLREGRPCGERRWGGGVGGWERTACGRWVSSEFYPLKGVFVFSALPHATGSIRTVLSEYCFPPFASVVWVSLSDTNLSYVGSNVNSWSLSTDDVCEILFFLPLPPSQVYKQLPTLQTSRRINLQNISFQDASFANNIYSSLPKTFLLF